MRAAYLFHFINLMVSILMVPVLLGGLSVADYAIWLAFVAFGNATIQIQNAVQNLVIKDIAREYHGKDAARFAAARRRTRNAYLALTALVLGPVMVGGLVYFRAIGAPIDASRIALAWVVFALAYALVYLCGPRSALLIGTGRTDVQNNINTLTRVVQLVGVTAALHSGFGILGLTIAFAVATAIGSLLSALAGRRIVGPSADGMDPFGQAAPRSSILGYICFAFTAYALYNGMYLVVAARVSRDVAASYGLSIQIASLLMAIATAPFNVWLGRLTSAVARDDRDAMVAEVARTFLIANLILVLGFVGLLLLGAPLLDLIGAAMRLPSHGHLVLVGCAFTIEANILVLVNYLMVRGDFGFIRLYVASAAVGIGLAVSVMYWTDQVYAFVALPAAINGIVTLPLLLRRAQRTLGGGAGALVGSAVAIVVGVFDRYRPARR